MASTSLAEKPRALVVSAAMVLGVSIHCVKPGPAPPTPTSVPPPPTVLPAVSPPEAPVAVVPPDPAVPPPGLFSAPPQPASAVKAISPPVQIGMRSIIAFSFTLAHGEEHSSVSSDQGVGKRRASHIQ